MLSVFVAICDSLLDIRLLQHTVVACGVCGCLPRNLYVSLHQSTTSTGSVQTLGSRHFHYDATLKMQSHSHSTTISRKAQRSAGTLTTPITPGPPTPKLLAASIPRALRRTESTLGSRIHLHSRSQAPAAPAAESTTERAWGGRDCTEDPPHPGHAHTA